MKPLIENLMKTGLVAGLIFMSGCNKEDSDDNGNNSTAKNMMEVVAESDQHTHLAAALEESGQADFYSRTDANVTLFAASDAAFQELFAEANVSSVSELKTQMGEEAFARMLMYHAVEGRFNYDNFADGHHQTQARNQSESHLTVHVHNDGNTRLLLNGNDNNGASTTNEAVVEASNGNVITIDAIVEPQSNFENIEDGEAQFIGSTYVSFMTNAEGSLQSFLQSNTNHSEVLVTSESQTQVVLDIYLSAILDENHLDNLLDSAAKTALMTHYSVSTTAELLLAVELDQLMSIGLVTMADIYAEMDAEARAKYLNHLIFESTTELKEIAENNGSISSKAGVNFTVESESNGQLKLTSNEGHAFLLDGKFAQSANGSVYSIAEVQ